MKSIADYLIKKVQICQKCIQVLPSSAPSESNLFNTDSFLQNLLHKMVRNIIQQTIEIIKNDCNFTYLYNEHVDHAFHLKESLIRNFVYLRISYFIKFYNQDIAKRNNTCKKRLVFIIHT